MHGFNIGSNPIGPESVTAFITMLATNQSLTHLNMSFCSIQEEDAVFLAKTMEKNSILSCLDISGNPIGSEGALALANMLKRNQCLKSLMICGDGLGSMIGVEDASELIASLEHNSTLESLWLSPKLNPSSSPNTTCIGRQGRVTFDEIWKWY